MAFEVINISGLLQNQTEVSKQWHDAEKPFRYFVLDNFLNEDILNKILEEYPDVNQGEWDGTTYIHQKNKFTLTSFSQKMPWVQKTFDELHSPEFLKLMEQITGINELIPDPELFGGGLHQSLKGAFLDVHVDFNIHEKTGFHRRMNAIIYMNPQWSETYNGYLELWDMKQRKQIENIAPILNRLVVFETNEVSFHGHPKPLNTPSGISRKSMAVYYYTKSRDAADIAEKHNTIYVNTEGGKGKVKTLLSGLKALFERVSGK